MLTASQVDAGKLKGSKFLSPTVVQWWVHDLIGPLESLLVRLRVSPNAISFTGFGLTILAAIALATNHLIWGGWLVVIAGCCDFLDGRVARRLQLTSVAGSFLDSCLDRYMDAAVFFGLAYRFRGSWVEILVYLALLGTMTTPYIRAKAESLGLSASGGQMQRPERIAYVGIGSFFSGYVAVALYPFMEPGHELPPYLLIFAIGLIALNSNKVAIERFWTTYQSLRKSELGK